MLAEAVSPHSSRFSIPISHPLSPGRLDERKTPRQNWLAARKPVWAMEFRGGLVGSQLLDGSGSA